MQSPARPARSVPDPATLLSSGGVAPSRRWRMRCWRDWLVPTGATSRAGSSTTGAARRRGGSPRYSRNEVPIHIAQKIFLWLMATGMVANRFCESPELGGTSGCGISGLLRSGGWQVLVRPTDRRHHRDRRTQRLGKNADTPPIIIGERRIDHGASALMLTRMRCWRDWLVPAGATSRAGSSTIISFAAK